MPLDDTLTFDNYPDYVLDNIARYLPFESLVHCMITCKRFRDIVSHLPICQLIGTFIPTVVKEINEQYKCGNGSEILGEDASRVPMAVVFLHEIYVLSAANQKNFEYIQEKLIQSGVLRVNRYCNVGTGNQSNSTVFSCNDHSKEILLSVTFNAIENPSVFISELCLSTQSKETATLMNITSGLWYHVISYDDLQESDMYYPELFHKACNVMGFANPNEVLELVDRICSSEFATQVNIVQSCSGRIVKDNEIELDGDIENIQHLASEFFDKHIRLQTNSSNLETIKQYCEYLQCQLIRSNSSFTEVMNLQEHLAEKESIFRLRLLGGSLSLLSIEEPVFQYRASFKLHMRSDIDAIFYIRLVSTHSRGTSKPSVIVEMDMVLNSDLNNSLPTCTKGSRIRLISTVSLSTNEPPQKRARTGRGKGLGKLDADLEIIMHNDLLTGLAQDKLFQVCTTTDDASKNVFQVLCCYGLFYLPSRVIGDVGGFMLNPFHIDSKHLYSTLIRDSQLDPTQRS